MVVPFRLYCIYRWRHPDFPEPEWLWALTEQWKSYAADGPSDFYILNTKIGGVLFAVFGAVALVLPLFLT